MGHYDDESLLEYVDGTSPIAAEIEAHAAGCTICSAEIGSHRETIKLLESEDVWTDASPSPARLADVAAFAARLKKEDSEAAAVCDEVLTGPSAWWPTRLRKAAGGRTAGVVRELLVRTRQFVERTPSDALQITTLAVELSMELGVADYPSDVVITLRAQALRDHAFVLSVIGRYSVALAVAERAEALFRQTPIPEYDLARLFLVKSNIYRCIERFEEAAALASTSADTFLRFGDRRRYVEARVFEGATLFQVHNAPRALAVFLSIEKEPSIANTTVHVNIVNNIGLCYRDLRQFDKSAVYLSQAAAEFDLLGLDVPRAKSRWALGTTLVSAGRLVDAVTVLRQAWRELETLELEADAALAALDLAEVLLSVGRNDEVPAICRSLLDRFTRAGMTSAAITALAFLRETVAIGQVTPAHVRHVHDFLRELPGSSAQLFAPPPPGRLED